jgi:excisionase family DNA binding protein
VFGKWELMVANEDHMETTNQQSAQLLTVSEIAQTLKVPISWVYERTRRRGYEKIPHFKLGKYLRFEVTAVSQWLNHMKED